MAWNTFSADAYRKFKDRWAARYLGDGYSVDFVSYSAVRHRCQRRLHSTPPSGVHECHGDNEMVRRW